MAPTHQVCNDVVCFWRPTEVSCMGTQLYVLLL